MDFCSFFLACVIFSNFVHCGELSGPFYGIQEIFSDEAPRAPQCEPGSDRSWCSSLNVPSCCSIIVESFLVRRWCHLCLLWLDGILFWCSQRGNPDSYGCSALHHIHGTTVSQWVLQKSSLKVGLCKLEINLLFIKCIKYYIKGSIPNFHHLLGTEHYILRVMFIEGEKSRYITTHYIDLYHFTCIILYLLPTA